ncbi:unnamed protein product [Caenorhabditis angaria]|uniref:Glycine zipper domain-containing protein n=1 Tax=Caenorhabditis angaria TaxID=860376 RepID=A0A9P1J2Q4_9PELO|nr:unnamed protein product [Caenorhabditis angaria]
MSQNYLFQVLSYAQKNHQLGNTLRGIGYQTGYAAAGAGIGGLTAGPFGALIGTIFGAVIGYRNSEDYGSLMNIVQGMRSDEQEKLAAEIRNLVGATTFNDFTTWFANLDHQRLLMDLLYAFIRQQSGSS